MSAEFETIGSPDRQRRPTPRAGHDTGRAPIRHHTAVPPVEIPPGHIGPVVLPGSGRLVYWTGRVAIGLRHQPSARMDPVPHSALWVQELMLGSGRATA